MMGAARKQVCALCAKRGRGSVIEWLKHSLCVRFIPKFKKQAVNRGTGLRALRATAASIAKASITYALAQRLTDRPVELAVLPNDGDRG
jgi:hypothetical protein